MNNTEKTMDKIVALCKNRGFVFPGSEIYGGLANTWDYGPLGAELKKNIKNAWWKPIRHSNFCAAWDAYGRDRMRPVTVQSEKGEERRARIGTAAPAPLNR